jgi:hypothetical protein
MRKIMGICGTLVLLAAPWICTGSVVSSGTTEIPGTDLFDFDTGVLTTTGSSADVWWDQMTTTTRAMQAQNGATLVNIGVVNFAAITVPQLEALSYGTTPIDGSNGTSVLVTGDVFAVHTNLGNYAKVLVTGPLDTSSDNGLPIQWETDSVPEPTGFAGLAVGAILFPVIGRRVRTSRGSMRG